MMRALRIDDHADRPTARLADADGKLLALMLCLSMIERI